MRCIRQNDVEISKEIREKYNLSITEYNKVKKIMCEDIDGFLKIEDLKKNKVDIELVSKAKVYLLDGIFTTLTSFVEMSKILRLMRKDVKKLEMAFEKIEKIFILFIETMNLNGVRHFSYADPSAMPEILGKHHEKWIVERFINLLDKLSHLNIVIHICPILFHDLKKRLDMKNKKVESYQDEFFKEKGFKVVGGSCIKNKNNALYLYSE
jgi:hypothetical protein